MSDATLRLASSRLAVAIAPPAALAGTRFDRTGSVAQVVLDGRHAFCGAEDGGTRGVGLCAEFGILAPIGYDDAAPGEAFLKPGVGALTRVDHRPYDFQRGYPAAPSAIEVAVHGCEARFACAPARARGWGVALERRLSVDGERLAVACTLRNCGERAFAIDEYHHNFLAAGPGEHRLALDGEVVAGAGWAGGDAQTLRWTAPVQGPRYAAPAIVAATTWAWRDPASGRAVRETVSRPWSRLALFVTPTLVCPEAFVRLELAPGEAASWRREWTFSADDRG